MNQKFSRAGSYFPATFSKTLASARLPSQKGLASRVKWVSPLFGGTSVVGLPQPGVTLMVIRRDDGAIFTDAHTPSMVNHLVSAW